LTATSAQWPLLDLPGPPAEQGRAHGRLLREAIEANVALYFQRFRSEAELDESTVRTRASAYDDFLAAHHPDFYAGVLGIAAGAGLRAEDVLALNVRYEILYSAIASQRLADGCTAFAVHNDHTQALPAQPEQLLIGQNWDWIPGVHGAVVRFNTAAGPTLAFTEAGIFGGKIGFNAAGIGLAINGMTSVDDDWQPAGLPFHARCWDVLSSASLDQAITAVTSGRRPCSAHYLLAQSGAGIASIEAAPLDTWVEKASHGRIVHANHFLHANRIGTVEAPYERRPYSVRRQARLSELLESVEQTEELQAGLRDHFGYPDSVCRHPSQTEPATRPYQTMTSVIMDLPARAMWIAAGTPCTADYARYEL
jgi:isopenicillin-N N-acyltransferase like protein